MIVTDSEKIKIYKKIFFSESFEIFSKFEKKRKKKRIFWRKRRKAE